MNPLSFDRQQWAFARILTAPSFNLGVGPWTVQPMWSKKWKGYGFELIECSRGCLPAAGEAMFQYRFGHIDGDIVGIETPANEARRASATPWDSATDAATAPNLRGYEVRIQCAPPSNQGGTPAWRTVWWGQVEYQEDTMWPGAVYPAGVRTYRCVDGFARTKRWPVNRHSRYGSGNWYTDVFGHPGYNIGLNGRILGNKDTNLLSSADTNTAISPGVQELKDRGDTKYRFHAQQGEATALTWTVQQALEDAMRKTRGKGEPIFDFSGTAAADLLGDTVAIPVRDGDTAWDLVSRMCSRQRGRGVVYVDWSDDVADPTGTLSVFLTIKPQTLSDITYKQPATGSSSTGTIIGATSAATTTTVDLIGDHRVVAEETKLADRFLHVADVVETYSEQIQVLATLSYYDATPSLKKRWDVSKEATFAALTSVYRKEEAWAPMWNLHGLPPDWNGMVGDHNKGFMQDADFFCDDNGAISSSAGKFRTSPLLVRVLHDLPLMEGYDYSFALNFTVARKIGTASYDETGMPARRPPLVLLRISDNKYKNGDDISRSLTVIPRGQDILIHNNGTDVTGGTRIIGSMSSTIGSEYDLAQLGITVGLELPHRVRMRTLRTGITEDQVRRILPIRLPNLNLWLAHPGAIWDLDYSTGTKNTGFASKKGCAGALGANPGIIRDDRNALARIHAMACSWYLEPRQTGSWTLKACGLLPSFDVVSDPTASTTATTSINYPVIGNLVTDFKAGGQITTFNTPITAVHYNHQSGKTTWETDWQELDFV